MCGYCSSFGFVSATGDQKIDGLIAGTAWSGPITYSFPVSATAYAYNAETDAQFSSATTHQQDASAFALDQAFGSSANDGFSIEGFTCVEITESSEGETNIRAAQSALPSTSWAYLPGDYTEAGDVWFGVNGGATLAEAGNYGWHTVLHEMGHAMGLKHGHEDAGQFGALPSDYDTLEKTVMTYRSYEDGPISGYSYERWGAPQTYMMADIAALQYMYGADFETNSGDTVYSWRQNQGDTYVNGTCAIDAGGDVIFATIWDGGGVDTYDLSGFKSRLQINLEPGEASTFNNNQLSNLGRGHLASGNIYNALQYEGDVRSLIENAIGGSNKDSITGNAADNMLSGGKAADKLFGHDGNDQLLGGAGNDSLTGGAGDDLLTGGSGADRFIFTGEAGADTILDFVDGVDKIVLAHDAQPVVADLIANAAQVGDDVLITFSDTETVTIRNLALADLGADDFVF